MVPYSFYLLAIVTPSVSARPLYTSSVWRHVGPCHALGGDRSTGRAEPFEHGAVPRRVTLPLLGLSR